MDSITENDYLENPFGGDPYHTPAKVRLYSQPYNQGKAVEITFSSENEEDWTLTFKARKGLTTVEHALLGYEWKREKAKDTLGL